MANSNTIELRLTVKDDGSIVIKQFTGEGVKDLEKLEKSSVSMTSTMGAGLQQLRSHWLAFTAATAGAIYVVQRVAKDALKVASDLEGAQKRFSIIFRDQIGLAEEWAETLRGGYAMSQREAKQSLSSMQDLLIQMGMNTKSAGSLSFEIVKLAADLGSFNELPTAQVLGDIESAMMGNYRAMRQYHIVLTDASVEQYALSHGLAKNADELTQAQRAWAAYNIILKKSGDAIGAMARNQDDYDTQLKKYHANIEDLKSLLGEALLPAATNVVKKFNEWVTANESLLAQRMPEYADRLTTGMEKLWNIAQKVGSVFAYVSIGETLSETRAEELVRRIAELKHELAGLESWKPNIINRIFGNTEQGKRKSNVLRK